MRPSDERRNVIQEKRLMVLSGSWSRNPGSRWSRCWPRWSASTSSLAFPLGIHTCRVHVETTGWSHYLELTVGLQKIWDFGSLATRWLQYGVVAVKCRSADKRCDVTKEERSIVRNDIVANQLCALHLTSELVPWTKNSRFRTLLKELPSRISSRNKGRNANCERTCFSHSNCELKAGWHLPNQGIL